MRLNQKVRYGLECLFELANTPTEYVGAEHVAAARHVPQAYAQKILSSLSQAGLVYSQKGAGFRIARMLEDISALEVVRALDATDHHAVDSIGHPLEKRIDDALAEVSIATLTHA